MSRCLDPAVEARWRTDADTSGCTGYEDRMSILGDHDLAEVAYERLADVGIDSSCASHHRGSDHHSAPEERTLIDDPSRTNHAS